MRHHNSNRKFGRERKARVALLRGLAVSLIRDKKITTTEAKAKELRPFMEKLITGARSGNLSSRRNAVTKLGGVSAAAKTLVEDIAPQYAKRGGGYTRVVKLAPRSGDASKMAVIEFVQ
jgi:large subunit ribosomal protein L17